jgi:hypothetical protein
MAAIVLRSIRPRLVYTTLRYQPSGEYGSAIDGPNIRVKEAHDSLHFSESDNTRTSGAGKLHAELG